MSIIAIIINVAKFLLCCCVSVAWWSGHQGRRWTFWGPRSSLPTSSGQPGRCWSGRVAFQHNPGCRYWHKAWVLQTHCAIRGFHHVPGSAQSTRTGDQTAVPGACPERGQGETFCKWHDCESLTELTRDLYYLLQHYGTDTCLLANGRTAFIWWKGLWRHQNSMIIQTPRLTTGWKAAVLVLTLFIGLWTTCARWSVLWIMIFLLCRNVIHTWLKQNQEQINGLVQERCNTIANTLELHLSCTNPSRWICAEIKSNILEC